jgi:molecular chaperone DnaK (HSP70)
MNKFFGKCSRLTHLQSTVKDEYYQDFDISCDDIGMLFTLKKYDFDITKSITQKYLDKENINSDEKEEREDKLSNEGQTKDSEQLTKMNLSILRKNSLSEHQYRLEEIYAMMLENIKESAEKQAEENIGSVAMTIWDNNLSIRHRKQLLDSMRLAGLKPTAFVHENTAAAIRQAINTKVTKDTTLFQVIYINIGNSGAKISLIEFDKIKPKKTTSADQFLLNVKVIDDYFDGELGSIQIDKCLYNVVTKMFIDKVKED